MKILYVSPVSMDSQKGDRTHFLELCKELQAAGNELVGVCRNGSVNRQGLKIKCVPNVEIPYLTTLLAECLFTTHLLFYLFQWRPEVLYFRGMMLGGAIARMFRIPSVAEAGGIYPDEIQMERPRFYRLVGGALRFRERVIYSSARRIICVTQGIKKELVDRYGVQDTRCEVIPNGVNTTLFQPLDKAACRKELGLEEKYFYLGFVGSFQPWQGLDSLIKAMSLLYERGYAGIRCILVGDGDMAEPLKEMVQRHRLGETVCFAGRVAYEKIPSFINSFDVCVAPFRKERNEKIGLSPLKLFEYLACARPVITSRIEGVREIVEEGACGFLFDHDDVEGLASRVVESYAQADSLSELGWNGRKWIEERYSWKCIARRVEEVLGEAVQQKHGMKSVRANS